MRKVHDMGGNLYFAPVVPEDNEPVFHHEWERTAMALTIAMGATGQWNIDQMRFARESLPAQQYLSCSYYEIWFQALVNMLISRNLVSKEELECGRAIQPSLENLKALSASQVRQVLSKGSPTSREPLNQPKFVTGQKVIAIDQHKEQGHTRLPAYVQGHKGTVVMVHGPHVLPNSRGKTPLPIYSEQGEWLYGVEFENSELWGDLGDANGCVSLDAWESYLEAA
jgi:nitrile hydratase